MYFYNEKGEKVYINTNANPGPSGPSGPENNYNPVVNPYEDEDSDYEDSDYADSKKNKKCKRKKYKDNTMEQFLYFMLIIIFIFISYCLMKKSKKSCN